MELILESIALGLWLCSGIITMTRKNFNVTKIEYCLTWLCLIMALLGLIVG